MKAAPVATASYRKEETIGFLLWDATRLHRQLFQRYIERHGVNIGQWPFIRELWEEDGLSIGELAGRSRMRGPTAVAAVQALEAQGLVKRVPHENDKRKVMIFLTNAGRALYEKVVPDIEMVANIADDGFSEKDIQALKLLLRRMRRNLCDSSTEKGEG